MLRVGMMGTWHVHTEDYLAQLRADGRVQIQAVWDEDAEAGAAWAAGQGLPFEPSLETFLAREDIDAVVCDAPTTAHRALLTRAAAAGKHIFTEKLLATNTEDALAICEAIEDAGVICTVSLPLLCSAWMRYAKQCIQSGTLGRVTAARMRRSHGGVSDHWLPARWFDIGLSGGGALMDLGSHPVYTLAFLLGSPVRVSGMMTSPYGTATDENAIVLVEFEGGVLATCETAFVTYGVPDILEVYGTEGSLFVRGEDIQLSTKEGTRVVLPEALPLPISQFVTACLCGGPAPANLGPRDALVMTQIIEAAYQSDRDSQTKRL